jgi:histidine kinase
MLKSISQDNIIYSGPDYVIVHDKSEKDKPRCLKILRTEFPSQLQLKQFENEFEFSHRALCQSVRKALKKTVVDNYPAILYDFIPGADLGHLINTGKLDFKRSLAIAANLARAVADIHRENIIHRNLHPGNVLVEAVTEKIYLSDFGLASRISVKYDSLNKSDALLHYISPEQTGRINRAVDHRADLYALGVIFYELFTGTLPFNSEDPLELIYAHLAHVPASPAELKKDLPPVLCNIILKLLEKNAENRYQSASGLLSDLELCLDDFSKNGTIEDFKIAAEDFTGKFSIQHQLYGREQQIAKMFTLFEHAAVGRSRFLLVSGYSGSGKSSMITELQKPVSARQGIFINGKFEQFRQDTPYGAFSRAFTELVARIMLEEEAVRDDWKTKILEASGTFGKILTDLIPDLANLVGPQPELPELKGAEVQNRFNYVLGNFVRAIAIKEHPLVIYIDDLQWADASSMDLLTLLVSTVDDAHLMIVGAYRNNELKDAPLLEKFIDELDLVDMECHQIELVNLIEKDVLALVKDTLHTRQQNVEELSAIVYSKTKGNAFYINQFLKSINEQGLLTFDFEKKSWEWDSKQLAEMNVSGNVVDLMTIGIRKLPAATIEVLKTAACLGNRFDIGVLAAVMKKEVKDAEELLAKPLIEGMLIPAGDGYKFAHDRVQEAIYQLTEGIERKQLHLHIGRSLAANTPGELLQLHIFDIVNQWNIGADLLTEPATKNQLSKLNHDAARKARNSSAYAQTLFYFEKSLALLPADHWTTGYGESLVLYNEATEAAYLCTEYKRMDELTEAVLKHGKNFLDTVKVRELNILRLILENKQTEAIATGLIVLKELGVNLPSKPAKHHILGGLLKTKMVLRNKSEDYFSALPEMTDPEKKVAIRIVYELLSPAYFGLPNLVPLLILKMVQLSVKHGLSRMSPFAFMGFGYIDCVFLGKVDSGMSFGKISLSMLDRFKIDELRASSLMSYHVFITHWKRHLAETIQPLEDGFIAGLETGDYEYSSYLAHNITYHSFLAGSPLHDLEKKSEQLNKQVSKFRQDLTIKRLELYRQSIANLVHTASEPDQLNGKIFNENEVNLPDVAQNYGYFQNLSLQKLMLSLYFNLDQKAYDYSITCRRYLESVQGSSLYTIFFFYESLAIAAVLKNKTDKAALLKAMKKNLKQLKKFETLCPENFTQKYMLVEAEYMHCSGQSERARGRFDRSIRAAIKNRMVHDEALAYERAGLYYLELKEENVARFYLQNAQSAYQRWGADAKVKQMRAVYGELLAKEGKGEHHGDLDLLTVMKASTAISGEIVLPKLLKKMMRILLENAGAQRGLLVMERKGELFIEAESSQGTDDVQTGSVPLRKSGKLAESVVKHVARKLESVILDNAVESAAFGKDEFIRKHQSKSVLCYPFINQGKLSGIIYLSNDLTSGTFTEERLSLLKMLTGQIAVSIENAALYENLELKVQERTVEIMHQKEIIEDKNKDILDSIKYARRIQEAILPPVHMERKLLKESFILYKPKDIVSGDFYFLEEKDEHVIVAAVDCTGHGVPGALMSVVGHNGLTRAVNERHYTQPSGILDYLNKSVNQTLRQTYEESTVKDGMDIAMCSFNFKNNTLQFAGAHNPLWRIRPSAPGEGAELTEIKADKQPIGAFMGEFQKPFTNHELEMLPGDVYYVFTDGYADQFGGERGKKFKTSQMKEMFLSIHKKPMAEQKEIILDAFNAWKGDLEQIDDVCVIGVKI